jgi:hypothetical protein
MTCAEIDTFRRRPFDSKYATRLHPTHLPRLVDQFQRVTRLVALAACLPCPST